MLEKLSANTNALNWFEISVVDMERAKKFYETIFQISMFPYDMLGLQMMVFPSQGPKIGGALVKSEMHKPSQSGAIVYLNANPNCQLVLNRIESAGGKITSPKTSIGENGYIAYFTDSEGNLVGLHSGE